MLPKVKKINLSSQLIDTMTTLIEENNWSPGSKLPNEVELAASLGVSRNIMREAMKILENFGILESKAGIGTFVSETALSAIRNMRFFDNLKSNTSIETILETRIIIEPELAYYAALRASEEDTALLQKTFDKSLNDILTNKNNDFDLHLSIAKCSRNPILENLLFTLLDQLKASDYIEFNFHVQSDYLEDSLHDHKEISKAIISHNPEIARDLMRKHLLTRIDIIQSFYKKD